MYRRPREFKEMAGWQCAAGRAILKLEAREMAPLAGTTKNTILRFERGEFMPRLQTVGALAQVLRERGVFPTFSKKGDPKGINIGYQAYPYAYPERPVVQHKTPEELGAQMRAHAPPAAEKIIPQTISGRAKQTPETPETPALAALEEQSKRLMAELRALKGEPQDDSDWSA